MNTSMYLTFESGGEPASDGSTLEGGSVVVVVDNAPVDAQPIANAAVGAINNNNNSNVVGNATRQTQPERQEVNGSNSNRSSGRAAAVDDVLRVHAVDEQHAARRAGDCFFGVFFKK